MQPIIVVVLLINIDKESFERSFFSRLREIVSKPKHIEKTNGINKTTVLLHTIVNNTMLHTNKIYIQDAMIFEMGNVHHKPHIECTFPRCICFLSTVNFFFSHFFVCSLPRQTYRIIERKSVKSVRLRSIDNREKILVFLFSFSLSFSPFLRLCGFRRIFSFSYSNLFSLELFLLVAGPRTHTQFPRSIFSFMLHDRTASFSSPFANLLRFLLIIQRSV